MAYFGRIFFANMGGGGGQNYVHNVALGNFNPILSVSFDLTSFEIFNLCDPAGVVQSPKTPESRKYEKIMKKIPNPQPHVAPRKYENITEKYKNDLKMTIFVFFR